MKTLDMRLQLDDGFEKAVQDDFSKKHLLAHRFHSLVIAVVECNLLQSASKHPVVLRSLRVVAYG